MSSSTSTSNIGFRLVAVDTASPSQSDSLMDISINCSEEPRLILPPDQAEVTSDATSSAHQLFADDDQVKEIVTDLCQITFVHNLGVLNDEAVVEAGPSVTIQGCIAADDDDSDELDSDSGSEDDDDEDEQAKRVRRRARLRANAVRNLQENSGRLGGRKKAPNTNALCDGSVEEEDDVDALFEYRRKMTDPLAGCPPPPPSKMKGGRKTLRKRTIETEIPEAAMKDMASCIISRQSVLHAEEVVAESTYGDPRLMTYPSGPFNRPMLQHAILSKEAQDAQEAVQPDKICKLNLVRLARSSRVYDPSQLTLYDLAFSLREPLSLRRQLQVEQFCSVLVSYFNATETLRGPTHPIDSVPGIDIEAIKPTNIREVLSELAVRIHTDPRKKHLKHWKLEDWESNSMLMDLNGNHFALLNTLLDANLSAMKAGLFLRKFASELEAVKRAKEFIQYSLESLHGDLSTVDPKMDELSITGTRQVKVVLTSPYFKTPEGLVCPDFSDPLFDLPHLFRTNKQKWTQKDLAALKVSVKEALVERAVEFVEARYVELQAISKSRAEEEIAENDRCLDEFNQPVKRRRGRPSKADVEKRDKYGSITPILSRLPNGAVVTYRVTPKQIGDWRMQKEKRWRTMSYDNVVKELTKQFPVNWSDACEKLMLRTRKLRAPEDCELAFNHEIDPRVNCKRFTEEEDRRLQEFASNPRLCNNWTQITKEMNQLAVLNKKPVRTSFFLFTRYKMKICPHPRLEWTPEMDNQLRSLISDHPGDWRKIAVEMNHERVTKREVVERFKKALNPMLRIGAFTRVEDALLLLTIERLKPFLLAEGHFGSLLAYLPWRYETTWRDRANNLFNDWIVPWTMEEDLKLLEMAVEYKRNWQKISEQFNSFKNRKGCLTRYKILSRHLKDERFKASTTRESVELYHEAYAMTRYNVFQYRHLREVLELLVRMRDFNAVEENKKFLEQHPFGGLESDKEPEEDQLRHMLITFDSDSLRSTIKSLRLYKTSRDSYWQKWIRQHGTRKRTFDRRTFHKDNPQSVASAIHIRELKLKKKEAVKGPPLNEFEEDVYVYFGRFLRTKPLKKDASRPYLPSPADLITWPRIARIVATSLKEVAEFKGACNKKWQRKGIAKKKRSQSASSRGGGGKGKGYGRKSKRQKLDDDVSSSEDEELPEHLDDEEEDIIETSEVDNHPLWVDDDPDFNDDDVSQPVEKEVKVEEQEEETRRRNPARAARRKTTP